MKKIQIHQIADKYYIQRNTLWCRLTGSYMDGLSLEFSNNKQLATPFRSKKLAMSIAQIYSGEIVFSNR